MRTFVFISCNNASGTKFYIIEKPVCFPFLWVEELGIWVAPMKNSSLSASAIVSFT